MGSTELTALTARAAVDLLRRGAVAPLDLVEAALARIAATDDPLNALPTLCPERAREAALRLAGRGGRETLLAGLPIAVKDLTAVAGVRTTQGSPIYAGFVPERSDILVERLERNGAIVLAKSNTPEFGAGANTFNPVFGETLNPWNAALTCGGSSGGSAAALAAGQVWLATGSDLAGSLRTPAAFCAVVGLRPSPGRVASGPSELPFGTLSVEGPMARTVGDVALMLDAMAGWDAEDPLSLPAPAEPFAAAAESRRLPARIAFSADLGITPVDPEVRAVSAEAARRFADAAGIALEEAHPDLADAPEIFRVLRAAGYVAALGPLYREQRDKLKAEIVWNIEQGLALDGETVGRAERARGRLYHRMLAFFARYDLLLCPAACAPPFDVRTRWLASLGGVPFDNYVEWLRLVSAITLAACPALALPCGFTADGRPVGMQIVGPPRGEAALLAAAAAFEEALAIAPLLPIDPRPPRPLPPPA